MEAFMLFVIAGLVGYIADELMRIRKAIENRYLPNAGAHASATEGSR